MERNERNDDRKMYKAKCSECGAECEVPFKPIEGREVFCKDCFRKKPRQSNRF